MAVAEAKEVFANSPKNLKLALDAAAEQFRANDPVSQLKLELQTPIEIFTARMKEIANLFSDAEKPADEKEQQSRDELIARAEKQARDQFEASDPDTKKVKEIDEEIKTDGQGVAEKLREAFALLTKGLIDRSKFGEFQKSLIDGELGEKPKPTKFSESIQSTNANIASQLGSFAPKVDVNKELLDYEKKKQKLFTEMRTYLKNLNDRRAVLQ